MPKMKSGTPVAEEYLISIIPELDKDKFDKEKKKVDNALRKVVRDKNKELATDTKQIKLETAKERLENQRLKNIKASNQAKQSSLKLNKQNMAMDLFIFKESSRYIKLIAEQLVKFADKVIDSTTGLSNKMIGSNSMFVDQQTRGLMAQFGVSGQTATGLGSVMDLMGLTPETMKYMTGGQMNLFSRLMEQWQKGMDSISKTDMNKFNDVVQNFQAQMASAKLDLQIEFYKLMVELAPELEDFFDTIIGFIRSLKNLLSSKVMKGLIRGLLEAVETLLKIISAVINAVSGNWTAAYNDLAGNNTTNNNNNKTITVTQTTTNNFTGDTNSMYGLANSMQESQTNYINNIANGTGSK